MFQLLVACHAHPPPQAGREVRELREFRRRVGPLVEGCTRGNVELHRVAAQLVGAQEELAAACTRVGELERRLQVRPPAAFLLPCVHTVGVASCKGSYGRVSRAAFVHARERGHGVDLQ